MTVSIRAISVLLIAWLTAAPLSPCCWPTSTAHRDQAKQEAPAGQHMHHHHGAPDVAVSTTAPVMRAAAVDECGTESLQAVLTTRAFVPSDVMRKTDLTFANAVALQMSLIRSARSDAAPPGCSPGAAFLNPLRV